MKPFSYVDSFKSYIVCNDGSRFDLASNYIFALEEKLDDSNDKKARKLCDYKIIRDYIDSYKAPNTINYTFYPVIKQESSYLNALFVALLAFFPGFLVIEVLRKRKDFFNLLIYLIS